MPEIGSLLRSQLAWDGTLGLKHPLLGIKTREGDILSQVKYERKEKSYSWQKVYFGLMDYIQMFPDETKNVNLRL